MSDEEEAGGFGGGASEEEDDAGGFGGGADEEDEEEGFGVGDDEEEEEEEDEGGGFGMDDLDEEEEAEEGFGEANDEEEGGFGGAGGDDEEEEATAAAPTAEKAPAAPEEPQEDYVPFAKKYFCNDNTHGYQLEPITAPCLKIKGKNRIAAALNVFVHICKWMGITAVVGKSTIGTMKTAAKILFPGLMTESLRDETYVQLMKQMTDNPARASRARGTILLTLMMGCYLPSKKMIPVLRHFIVTGPPGYKTYLTMLLRRTGYNGPRAEPPTSLDLKSAKLKQICKIPIKLDMITGDSALCRLDAASTREEFVNELCHHHGITNTKGWTININRFGKNVDVSMAGTKHMMDEIAKVDFACPGQADYLNLAGQLTLKRAFLPAGYDPMSDEAGTVVTYHQIQKHVAMGKLKLESQEAYNEIVAQMYYVEYGDMMEESNLKAIMDKFLPAAAKKELPTEKRQGAVEKVHAKATYCRKQLTQLEVQSMVVTFAMETWKAEFAKSGAAL